MNWVSGKIHPDPPKPDGLPRSFLINSDEADKYFQKMVGKPLLLCHDWTKPIGRVERVRRVDNGDMMVDAYVNPRNPLTPAIHEALRAGRLKGLSMGYNAMERNGERLTSAYPTEVSIVDVGAIPKTRVLAFGNSTRCSVSQSGFKEVMAEQPTASTTPATQTVAGNAPTAQETAEVLKSTHTFSRSDITTDQIERFLKAEAKEKQEKTKALASFFEMAKSVLAKTDGGAAAAAMDPEDQVALGREVEALYGLGNSKCMLVEVTAAQDGTIKKLLEANEALRKQINPLTGGKDQRFQPTTQAATGDANQQLLHDHLFNNKKIKVDEDYMDTQLRARVAIQVKPLEQKFSSG